MDGKACCAGDGMSEVTQPELDERSALAAKMFPRQWAAAIALPGKGASKKRKQLRQRAARQVILDRMKADGKICVTCKHYEKYTGVGEKNRMHCSMHSDFEGYVFPEPNDLCLQWSAKQ